MTLRNLEYIWRWADLIQRGIYIGLALMLAYTVFVLIRFLRYYPLARLQRQKSQEEPSLEALLKTRDLVSELSRGLRTLKAISLVAPFLGLSGTSYGILAEFYGFAMSRSSVIEYLLRATPSRLVNAAAGILVAIPAIVIYNALRNRVEKMREELFSFIKAQSSIHRPFRRAQTLPLKRRFSRLPPYALIAAPVFATVVIVYMLFKPYELPKGLPVHIAVDRCEPGLIDRRLVLRVTEGGKLFLNFEQEDWKGIQGRLAEIYRMRRDRVLYLQAEDGVPFQQVAEAIGLTRNLFGTSPNSPDITVRLITPRSQAESALCHAPIWSGPTVRLQR